ncbi:MAG: alginate O-acetyltransferase AlgX-related protein [Bacteroidia bacterium]
MKQEQENTAQLPAVKASFSRLLLVGFMVLLLLPIAEEYWNLFRPGKLRGAYEEAKEPTFSRRNFWEGVYQDSFNTWHNENFGFRTSYVRIHNQFDYSLFRVSHASGVLIGKENYLYEQRYAETWNGQFDVAADHFPNMGGKLRLLQDSLAARGITLLVVLAPSKAHFYPEFLPDRYAARGKKNYYTEMRRVVDSLQINAIDFNAWALQNKKTSPYPIFPKTGIHWSTYASTLATDSIIHWIEKKRNIDMVNLTLGEPEFSSNIREPDNDIELALNLLWGIPKPKMAYHPYSIEAKKGKAEPRLMVIADSFYWSIFNLNVSQPNDYWYYNKEVYHSNAGMNPASDYNVALETKRHDVVILMATDPNTADLGWGYIDVAYNFFVTKKISTTLEELADKYQGYMRQDPKWMEDLRLKAEKNNVPLEEMMRRDALYMAGEDLKNVDAQKK